MMMAVATLLMTSCTADDVVKETTSAQGIAISFSCNYDNEEENETRAADQDATGITRTGQQGAMNTEDLYATGFGVMASVTAGNAAPYDNKPNLMYNQEVKYTFVGDLPLNPEIQPVPEPYRGYWSYYPLKYWPSDLEHCYISAYAPYVEPSELEGLSETKTGIVGISGNNEAPYITYRRCKKPNEVVDLLWYYKKFESTDKIPEATTTKPAGTLNMKMRHALARLEIQVALAAPASGKVLIEEITLTGEMTKTANLILNKDDGTGDNHYPHWEALATPDTENRTIQITNIDNDDDSYGIIDAPIRYIPGMPYNWQPEGLTTTAQNALSTGDRKGYVFLIPQETLALKINVKYHKMTTAGGDTPGEKSIDASPDPTPITISPLYGNTTYLMKIKLSDI